MIEKWKKIPNFSRYEASTMGRLRSLNYKNSGVIRVLKPAISNDGYLKTMLQNDQKKYCSWTVHKWICLTFLGNRNGLEVNHIDGSKINNSLNNLEYCTRSENILHGYNSKLIQRKVGSLNGMAKLKEQDVIEIRLHASLNGRYYGRKMLAEKYKVSECTIKEVVTRRKNKFYNV